MTREKFRPAVETDDAAAPGESFLQRFHRRKTEARQAVATDDVAAAADAAAAEPPGAGEITPPPTDADMPPIESLSFDSDYTGFLSERVSESLRRAALRKLFHSAEFNVVDGLDDYAEEFTTFTALGDIVTADMKHQIEVAARRRIAALDHSPEDAAEDVVDEAAHLARATGTPASTDDEHATLSAPDADTGVPATDAAQPDRNT